MVCEYCDKPDPEHLDHVIPASLARKYEQTRRRYNRPPIPDKWLVRVYACTSCNWRKFTRRLVPPSWEKEIDELNAFFAGPKWQVWRGNAIPEVMR